MITDNSWTAMSLLCLPNSKVKYIVWWKPVLLASVPVVNPKNKILSGVQVVTVCPVREV